MITHINALKTISIHKEYVPHACTYIFSLQEWIPPFLFWNGYWHHRYTANGGEGQLKQWIDHYQLSPTNVPETTDTTLPPEHYLA